MFQDNKYSVSGLNLVELARMPLVSQSNRRPAFEDKNWCNNMMTTNADTESVAWSDATNCGHTEQGYNGVFGEDWQAANTPLPVT